MSTATIELPQEVYHLAKQTAKERHVPLADLVASALRTTVDRPWMKTPWMKTAGALADLHEENKRIKALLTEEFRTLPEEQPAR